MSKEKWIQENLAEGEIYAGIVLGEKDARDYHLVLLPGADDKTLTWDEAMAAAKDAGGSLPTRREQALLFANAKAHFKAAWYWSSEEYAPGSRNAWLQFFNGGNQSSNDKGYAGRARAVRRLEI
jgi:hypothetical protein